MMRNNKIRKIMRRSRMIKQRMMSKRNQTKSPEGRHEDLPCTSQSVWGTLVATRNYVMRR